MLLRGCHAACRSLKITGCSWPSTCSVRVVGSYWQEDLGWLKSLILLNAHSLLTLSLCRPSINLRDRTSLFLVALTLAHKSAALLLLGFLWCNSERDLDNLIQKALSSSHPAASTPAPEASGSGPESVLGQECEVHFPMDEEWYKAVVRGYDRATKLHNIWYFYDEEVRSPFGTLSAIYKLPQHFWKLPCMSPACV